MAGRGRGRPPARADAAAGAGRRSTRGQQQQQQQQQQQEQQRQQQERQEQPEEPPHDPQIDPAIATSQAPGMAPPPVPSARKTAGRIPEIARRGTTRASDANLSIASVNEVLPSSQAYESSAFEEPPSQAHRLTPERASSGPVRTPVFQTPHTIASRLSGVSQSTFAPTAGHSRGRGKVMRQFVDKLQQASRDLTDHLVTFDPKADATDADDWMVQWYGHKDLFRAVFQNYLTNPGSITAELDYVLSYMDVRVDDALYPVVTQVIAMANLASILNEMTLVPSADTLIHLQSVEIGFPGSCIVHDAKGEPTQPREEILRGVLELRTQLLLHSLQRMRDTEDPPHPLALLSETFLVGATADRLVELMAEDPLDLPLRPAGDFDFDFESWDREIYEARIRNHYEQLKGGVPPDPGSLFMGFEYEEFTENFRAFLVATFNKTKALLEASTQIMAREKEDSAVRSQLEQEASAHGRIGAVFDAIDAINRLEQRPPGPGGTSDQSVLSRQVHSSAYPPAPSAPYPNFASFGEQPAQPNGALHAESAAQATPGSRKRRAPAGGEAGPAAAKKPRARRKQEAAPPSIAPGDPAGALQYPLPASSAVGFVDSTDFEAVSQRSREISAANRKAREPQVRSAWVRNDVKQLVRAVDVYKCKWSTIEKEIKAGTIVFEIPRDQQALRDKARLLKQDFLKADSLLPPSFDLVVLGKKEREAVKAVGKNPDRREADVGPDGRPVNTEHAAETMVSSATLAPTPAAEAIPAPPTPTMPEAPMDVPPVDEEVEATAA